MTLAELCRLFGWTLRRDAAVDSLGFIDVPLDGRLVFALDRAGLEAAVAARVAAVLLPPALAGAAPGDGPGIAVAPEPRRAFVKAHEHLATQTGFYGPLAPTAVDPTAQVHPRAILAERGVVIGPGCRIEAGAVIAERVTLGARVTVMPNAVLGAEGFQRFTLDEGVHQLTHAGGVHVGEGSVVMAGAVVARAVFRQATEIGPRSMVGNAAVVSHNVRTGARCVVGHGAVVCGNVRLGEGVTIGPGAVLCDRITVGDGATVSLGAVVVRPVAARTRVSGNFATGHRALLRATALAGGRRPG